MKKILVTGANGHIGQTLCSQLAKDKNIDLVASVRNLSDTSKVKTLKTLNLKLVEAEMSCIDSLNRITNGCDIIIHLAANYSFHTNNPQKEIYQANMQSTKNIFLAAKNNSVKRIIYISSMAAVGMSKNGETRSELDWNDNVEEVYSKSKNDSERLAWKLAKEYDLELVTLLPGAITGPGFEKHTPTTNFLYKVLNSQVPMLMNTKFSYIDVRDIVLAIEKIITENISNERLLAVNEAIDLSTIFDIAKKLDSTVRKPRLSLPDFLIPYLHFFDKAESIILKKARLITKETSQEYLETHGPKFDNSKITDLLDWKPRSSVETLNDTFDWITTNKPQLPAS